MPIHSAAKFTRGIAKGINFTVEYIAFIYHAIFGLYHGGPIEFHFPVIFSIVAPRTMNRIVV